jgi:hypothetical protein
MVSAIVPFVSDSMTLYGCIEKDSMEICRQSERIMADRRKTYIGLRHDGQGAFDRAKEWNPNLTAEDAIIFSVRFSLRGWFHATTTMRGTKPLLEHMTYSDGIDWGVWHFNDHMPLKSICVQDGEVLYEVTFHPVAQ